MFVYFYSIGLVIGLVIYALTYLFVREMKNIKRVLAVAIIGVLCLIGSIVLIGGFAGMPIDVLSLGILTISFLLVFFGKSSLWKKSVYTVVLLFVVFYSAFMYLDKADYWVVKKTQTSNLDEVGSYIQQLQNDPKIHGYKTFTISEGKKGIVLSLGGKMAGNNIEVLNVKENGDTTEIKIRTFYNQSREQNPFVTIGLDRLQPNIIIMDTDGTIYEKSN